MISFIKINYFRLFFLSSLFLLTGCGESVLKSLENDQTLQAKQEAAQVALDQGDCQTAIDLFWELQTNDPENLNHRIDLSGAYLCQAGFSTKGFLKVASDFLSTQATGTKAEQEAAEARLFKRLIENGSGVIPDEMIWKSNLCKSKALLGTVTNPVWPCPSATENGVPSFFHNNADAGFFLGIVNLADVTLTLADALNTITANDLSSAIQALIFAQQSTATVTGTKDQGLLRTINNIVAASDTNGDGRLNNEEMLNYLVAQKLVDPSNPSLVVPPNCVRTGNPVQYICS